MSYEIGLVVNTMVVPHAFTDKVEDALSDVYEDNEPVVDAHGHLMFDVDHEDHMDYLSANKKLLSVLAEAKVNGCIAFMRLDGPEYSRWWSYNFTDGVCEEKTGKVSELIPR